MYFVLTINVSLNALLTNTNEKCCSSQYVFIYSCALYMYK